MIVINIKAVPGAKVQKVLQQGSLLKVYVNAPATDGNANRAVIKLLANHYQVKIKDVQILKGLTTRLKKVGIQNIPL